ncbi:DUF3971 domain-containing protein [Roseivivax sp. THAF197b]|uniref:YhdP family protein n=1 Tax=Roseivivax sp. THAF197b TaxID=2588299 RepID=UPI0012693656|nr:DUF3971 domain-containing protein [Roseivivax sp. THAF197b]QFS82791.1 hypothetical protein FIV09_08155 [Roseivivax sp. THAF197b]
MVNEPEQDRRRSVGARAARFGGWTLGLLATVAAALALILWSALDRPLNAPDWLRKEVEARIDRALPGFDIGFSDLRFQVLSEGLVRIGLSNVTVATDAGEQVGALTEIRAGLSARALVSRQLALREAQASGLFLSLERDRTGALSLGLGLGPRERPRPDLPTVLAQVDRALNAPLLSGLDEVTLDAITLRYDDARAGRGWTADGGRMVARRQDGRLRLEGDVVLLGGAAGLANVTVSAESDIGAQDLSFALSLENLASTDIATQSPALAWLGALRAPISGDLGGYLDSDGTLGGLDVVLAIDAGALQPNPNAEPVEFASARTSFSFAPESRILQFSEIAVDSAVGRARAEGQVSLQGGRIGPGDTGLEPASFVGQFTLSDLAANPRGLFEAPIEIAEAETDLRLSLDPFSLDIGRLRIVDEEVPLRAKGRVSAGPEGWDVALDATLARTDPASLAQYWPAALAPQTRDWFTTNVMGGAVRDAQIALRLDPASGRLDRHIDLRFKDAEVRFAQTLPSIEAADGQLVIAGERLTVMLERGQAVPPEGGAVDVSGSSFVIADTGQKPATGDIRLATRSSVTALLSFLDQEPLRLMARAERSPDLIEEGQITAEGRLTLPLKSGIQFSDLTIDLAGEVTGAESSQVVPGRVLRAERLAVRVTESALEVAGDASLSDVPASGTFRLPIGEAVTTPATVTARIALSDAAARAFGVALPSGLLSGSGSGDFAMSLPRDGARPRFTLSSDLRGLALSVPALGWRLGAQQSGRFEIAGRLGSQVTLDGLSLSGAGLSAQGNVILTEAGGFRRLELPQVSLGNWFDGAVTLIARGAGQVPAIVVSGGRLDLRRATFGTGNGGGGGGGSGGFPLSVALDRLVVTEGIVFRDLEGDFQVTDGLNGRFRTGIVGKSTRLTGAARPQNDGTAIQLQSDDAGAILEATGLFQNVDDGTLDLTLIPVRGATGTYDGKLRVREARLREAPALAAMLDAVSVVGLLDELNGAGIYFTDVQADFRLTPRQVILRQSSATGPSMGISVDGYIDLATKALDLQGVFSPLYFINAVGQVLTRRGEGLFGFNFNIDGTADQPRVAVNPLSVFTPGMFREIFRRPPPSTGN